MKILKKIYFLHEGWVLLTQCQKDFCDFHKCSWGLHDRKILKLFLIFNIYDLSQSFVSYCTAFSVFIYHMGVGLNFLAFVFLKHMTVCEIEMYVATAWSQSLLEKRIYISLSWYPLYLCQYLFEWKYYRVKFKVVFS